MNNSLIVSPEETISTVQDPLSAFAWELWLNLKFKLPVTSSHPTLCIIAGTTPIDLGNAASWHFASAFSSIHSDPTNSIIMKEIAKSLTKLRTASHIHHIFHRTILSFSESPLLYVIGVPDGWTSKLHPNPLGCDITAQPCDIYTKQPRARDGIMTTST